MKHTKVSYGEQRRIQNPHNQFDATQIRIDLEASLDGEETFSAALSELKRLVGIKLQEAESDALDRFNGVVKKEVSAGQSENTVPSAPVAPTIDPEPDDISDEDAIVANLNWDDDFLV